MSAVSSCLANGSGLVGSGCVSDATSPAIVLAGYFLYWIGNNGVPLTRSNTKTWPVFVVIDTASTSLPSRLTVINEGGEGRSRSQISCFTVWKCQIRLPVFASSARRVLAKRLSPSRSRPMNMLTGFAVATYTMPRWSSRLMPCQEATLPVKVQASFGHVSYPNSPGCGTVLNVHRSLPVRASYARTCPERRAGSRPCGPRKSPGPCR